MLKIKYIDNQILKIRYDEIKYVDNQILKIRNIEDQIN